MLTISSLNTTWPTSIQYCIGRHVVSVDAILILKVFELFLKLGMELHDALIIYVNVQRALSHFWPCIEPDRIRPDHIHVSQKY